MSLFNSPSDLREASNKFTNVAVIGAGAWGTALAQLATNNLEQVFIYDVNQALLDEIESKHANEHYLPKIKLSPKLKTIKHLEELKKMDLILLVVPVQAIRAAVNNLKQYISPQTTILICSKGIENSSLKLISEVIAELLPQNNIAALSGPNFANEIALGKISAAAVACSSQETSTKIINTLGSLTFRPYYSDDIIGLQVAGATKNIIAIAAGILEALKLGENARAALITRGLAEIGRLMEKMGGKRETCLGLSGVGDLVLTASSISSRNFKLGYKLGSGEKVEQILSERTTYEGYYTTKSVYELAKKLGLDLPICEAVYHILYEHQEIRQSIENLMHRPFKAEY